MPCVICKSPLTQVGILSSELHPHEKDILIPEGSWVSQGPLHCPKCKLVYNDDPDGEDIVPDLVSLKIRSELHDAEDT